MDRKLRVLIVEDAPDDAYLVERHLRRHGFDPVCIRVETAAEMREALESGPFDVVISDYLMPEFSALGALKVTRDADLDVPFLVVSGSIGEDAAVEAMRNGVHDYLMKDSMARLGVAVERELAQATNRTERRKLLEALTSRISDLLHEVQQAETLEEAKFLGKQVLERVRELVATSRDAAGAAS